MNDDKAPNNVIQFPGQRKKEADEIPAAPTAQAPSAAVATAKKPSRKTSKKSKAITAGTVLAIILATGAVNRFTFDQKIQALDASSVSTTGRAIASVERTEIKRDSAWEKDLAESLASAQVRAVASTGLGHAATVEEKLRWGTLEEKYTIVYKSDVHNIETIVLQDATTNPAYILDRNKFLRDYGQLLQDGYASSTLKSVEVNHDKTVESYTLYDKDKRPKGEAHFELDIHKRLLSLKVESSQI
ncbi:MAG: hypothetical protein ACXVA9_03555 [Bdellovibrionales bacterium]